MILKLIFLLFSNNKKPHNYKKLFNLIEMKLLKRKKKIYQEERKRTTEKETGEIFSFSSFSHPVEVEPFGLS